MSNCTGRDCPECQKEAASGGKPWPSGEGRNQEMRERAEAMRQREETMPNRHSRRAQASVDRKGGRHG